MLPKSDFQKLKEIVKKNLELKKKRGSYDTFILSRNNRKYQYTYNSNSNVYVYSPI
jgi:hypothetical protein